ncbi:MAG: 23S rRNA (guanosine(2251)-2'-O)-methyltransferase RlmB [Saprospiraceae bacterium]
MIEQIFGRNPVMEALQNDNVLIERIYINQTLSGEFEKTIRQFAKEKDIVLTRVPEQKLKELSKNKNHQGIIATIAPIQYQDYTIVMETVKKLGKTPLVIILDNITDVRNIGAIGRSAHFFGVDMLILSGNSTGSVNDLSIKTSSGALLHLPVCKAKNLFTVISDLQSMGLKVVSTSTNNPIPAYKCEMVEPTAIIFGSEGTGIHHKISDVVDENIQIPAINEFDSLNVSVAAGIVLYEVQKQRANV